MNKINDLRYNDRACGFLPIEQNPHKDLLVRKIVAYYTNEIQRAYDAYFDGNYNTKTTNLRTTILPSDVVVVQNEEVYFLDWNQFIEFREGGFDDSSAALIIDVIIEGGAGLLIEQAVRKVFNKASRVFVIFNTQRAPSPIFHLTIKWGEALKYVPNYMHVSGKYKETW